jgi:hypothetical protein
MIGFHTSRAFLYDQKYFICLPKVCYNHFSINNSTLVDKIFGTFLVRSHREAAKVPVSFAICVCPSVHMQ